MKAFSATLEGKENAILKPKATAKAVLNLAKKAGMRPEDIAIKLGLKIEE